MDGNFDAAVGLSGPSLFGNSIACVGDINGDGLVNFLDFSLLGQQWGQTGCGSCSGADLSGDNNVTMADVLILAKNWLSDF